MQRFLIHLVCWVALACSGLAGSSSIPLSVTVSFSILKNLVEEVGGNHVIVTTIVPCNADPHTYQPKMTDARNLARADIVFVNGLGFEGWLDKLIKASGFKGPVIIVSQKVKARNLPCQSANDPHAWHNVENAILYVGTIVDTLASVDPANAPVYKTKGHNFIQKLQELHKDILSLFEAIPCNKRNVVTTHDAFWYFGEVYRINFFSPIGINTDMQPSAAGMARLIREIRKHNITGIFLENLSNKQLLAQIAREVNVTIGGTLYADSLSHREGSAPTYITMMLHNARVIASSLEIKPALSNNGY